MKYINYQIKTNLHQEVMYYVTDVKQPVLSASYMDQLGFSFNFDYFLKPRIYYDDIFIGNLTKKDNYYYWVLPDARL